VSVNIQRNFSEWKVAKTSYRREAEKCPRCNNVTHYQLVWDADGIGLPGILTFKYNKQYALKCPICPNVNAISKEVAEAIMRGGA
jgi:phage FluMu protein Com